MTLGPQQQASGGGGPVAQVYTQAYCAQCAALLGVVGGQTTTVYPGHYDADTQNCEDWANAHVTSNPTHTVSLRREAHLTPPVGI